MLERISQGLVISSALLIVACGDGGSGGEGGSGGGGGDSTGATMGTTTGGTTTGGGSASLQEAAENACNVWCDCLSCSDEDRAGCVAEFGKSQGSASCDELSTKALDCIAAKVSECPATSFDGAAEACTPPQAEIDAACK